MKIQTVVLDTSILLSEGKRVFDKRENTEFVIPMTVVRELDKKKSDPSVSYTARSVTKVIRNLIQDNPNHPVGAGIPLGKNCTLRVERNHVSLAKVASELKIDTTREVVNNDTKIIAVAYNLKEELDREVFIATNDMTMVILADTLGLKTISLETKLENREWIDQVKVLEVDPEFVDDLYAEGTVTLPDDVPMNTPVVLKNSETNKSALAISKNGYNFSIVKDQTVTPAQGSSPVVPKSKEQQFFLKMLHDDTIKAVSVGGVAGGGKTMLALAKGVEHIKNNKYKKIVVFRSMRAVGGEELGYLPGTEQEKLDPWTAAVYDALQSFLTKPEIDKLKRDQVIEVLPITHVRGRTFHNSWVIVDESQNLEKSVILTLLTRMSHSSKIVLTHDISQIDNRHVGRYSGIYEVVSRLHGNPLFAHVSMTKSERSELAQTAAKLLDDY